ncbi:hypothetical protein [Pseudomonas typographi]|uniref:Uncharacterized protein n=1 Tax=Pseudomonas typographi TaxID=2715964 RepID=A0ABR7ZA35_9PSED|nr:hypothetical protein [Pseudomonas typographi]MBD1602282.1 hypothetical protein [Pseudomonas typographi]
MSIEYKAEKGRFGDLKITQSHIENWQARIALGLIDRFGLIAAEPDGFDEAGRQKGRVLSPEEVVTRAFSIAELAVKEIADRGWLIPVDESEKA